MNAYIDISSVILETKNLKAHSWRVGESVEIVGEFFTVDENQAWAYEYSFGKIETVDFCTIGRPDGPSLMSFMNGIRKVPEINRAEIKSIDLKEVERFLNDNSPITIAKKLNITHVCGSDLVNIKFQNCSEKVVLTKISLFDDKKQLMGIFKVDEGMFYKSITNLAYGKYFYKAQQLDKENNVIVETDFVEFVIRAPYYGKPFVCN